MRPAFAPRNCEGCPPKRVARRRTSARASAGKPPGASTTRPVRVVLGRRKTLGDHSRVTSRLGLRPLARSLPQRSRRSSRDRIGGPSLATSVSPSRTSDARAVLFARHRHTHGRREYEHTTSKSERKYFPCHGVNLQIMDGHVGHADLRSRMQPRGSPVTRPPDADI